MEGNRNLLPKNMRQIGEREERLKIYVEDYVFGFFRNMKLTTEAWRVGVLLGYHEEREGVPCLFITGAVETRVADFTEGRLKFTDETWRDVFLRMENHFPGVGICGWFVYEQSGGVVDKLSLKKTHEEAFAHGEKVLFLHDDQGEEAFYSLHKGRLEQMKGYYIYYERNEAMQSYVFGRRRGEAVEEAGSEKVVEDFRAKMEDKKKEQIGELLNRASGPAWNRLRTASACAAAVALVALRFAYNSQNLGRTSAGEVSDPLYENAKTAPAEEDIFSVVSSEVKEVINQQLSDALSDENTEGADPEEELTKNVSWEAEGEAAASGRPGYLVEKGETLSRICSDLYGDLDRLEELCSINGIEDPDMILSGQIIYLP